MSNKVFFLLMRGIGAFLREFRLNLFSLITLCTLIFVYHIICVSGTGAAGFLAHIARVNTVRAYLSQDVKEPADVVLKLAAIEGVSEVKYYSPKDAKEFVVANAPNIAGIKSFADDFFPAFAELVPSDSSDGGLLERIEASAAKVKGVDTVSYGKEFMSRFIVISRGAWVFITVISALFASAAAFTVYNTVRLSLYKFREEIRLYSLVGGTRPFIAAPYVFSSLLQAAAAYIAASFIFIVVFNIFNGRVLQPAGINIFYLPGGGYFAAAFAVACVIASFSAMTGVVSFLKKVSSINED